MEPLTMTSKELRRIQTLQRVRDGYLTQAAAAAELGLCERQVRRLAKAVARDGPTAVASKRRGKAPSNRISEERAQDILARYRAEYHDFGPTLFCEMLAQRHGMHVSREWVRRLLIANDLWRAKKRKRSTHPPRERRPMFGELVQIDGSPHDWFEGRAEKCTLLLDIDDATSKVCSARFEPTETTDGYFRLLRSHIERFGRFGAAYADKHSIFRYSGQSDDPNITTQLHRALTELDIELICANSPQAKGRVERANRTFQDRLTKAMRLADVSSVEAGNDFLPAFVVAHNTQFAIEPAEQHDAHRSARAFDLNAILCRREERVVTKNLTFQLDDTIYALIDAYSKRQCVAGARIDIRIATDGSLRAFHNQHELCVERRGVLSRNATIVGSKDLNAHLDRRIPSPQRAHTPAANHPWRTYRLQAPQPDIFALQEPDITALR